MARRPAVERRCSDCKLFGSLVSQPNKCGWLLPESTGPNGTFANECPLFTLPDGSQPLLDCEEKDLPEWTTAEQMSLFN